MNFIFGKFGQLLIGILFSFVAGMFLMQKVFTPIPEKIDYEKVRLIVAQEINKIPCDADCIQPK